jgi:HlyD family secretion protein
MTATIRIVVDRRDDVLRAPDKALRYSPRDLAVPNGAGSPIASPDGSSRLWILRHRKPSEITVQLGLDDGAYTEIVEGDVQPGDELIIDESGGVSEKPAAMRSNLYAAHCSTHATKPVRTIGVAWVEWRSHPNQQP